MADFHLQHGIAPDLRAQAVDLYWRAFGPKLGRVMRPEAKARRYLMRVMQTDNCFAALDGQGRLLGLAGFKTDKASFAGGTMADLAAVYGGFGSLWRGMLLRRLGDEAAPEHFLLDGLCVDDDAQGQGIGTALLQAICAEARLRGYDAVRLDVVDSNTRARALYERCGFRWNRTARLGPLRVFFGYSAAWVMLRPV